MRERATEYEWLLYFYQNADFGPAHEDVVNYIFEDFCKETGKKLPENYAYNEDYIYDTAWPGEDW